MTSTATSAFGWSASVSVFRRASRPRPSRFFSMEVLRERDNLGDMQVYHEAKTRNKVGSSHRSAACGFALAEPWGGQRACAKLARRGNSFSRPETPLFFRATIALEFTR